MPEFVDRSGIVVALERMDYEIHMASDHFIMFRHAERPDPHIQIGFISDRVRWSYLRESLRYAGVDIDVFVAEIESM